MTRPTALVSDVLSQSTRESNNFIFVCISQYINLKDLKIITNKKTQPVCGDSGQVKHQSLSGGN